MPGLRVQLTIFLLLVIAFACNQPQKKKAIIEPGNDYEKNQTKANNYISCKLPIDYSKIDTSKSDIQSSASYSYDIASIPSNYPVKFKENHFLLKEDTDTLDYYLAQNNAACYVIWYESMSFESAADVYSMSPMAKAKAEAQVDSILNSHLTNGIPRLGKTKVTYHCLGLEGKSHNIVICAEDDTYGYIYKHVTGDIPRSHASVHFIYRYKKVLKAKYWDLGAFLAMSLGGSPETI